MTFETCVALRKNGKPCRAVAGLIFDPHWNGKVCDAHLSDTRLNPHKWGRLEASMRAADDALAEAQRQREALILSLSEDGLHTLLKEMRKFREGSPLKAKIRKLLDAILRENQRRELERKHITRKTQEQKEFPRGGDAVIK
jgi:uncharacterized protein YicC (UPF0701 family)